MKVDAVLTSDLDKAGAEAQELEEMGYDGLKSIETGHDPFSPCCWRHKLPEILT